MFQVTGPTRGARRRPTVVLGAIVASAMLVGAGLTVNVLAVHDVGVFQLDGNADTATNPAPVATDDWDRVCYQARIEAGDSASTAAATCGTSSATAGLGGAKAVSWVSEPDRSTSIFTGGGSKDPNDLSNWLWKDAGGLPDKDNLRHAFAARYSNAHELLYFGSDRFDNSGDAQQGFWFLQAPLAADGVSSAGGFKFTDGSGGTPAHTVGDLLVISDFSNGGTVSTINIYSWVASGGDTTTNLDFVDGGISVKCAPTLTGDNFCGIVNPTTTSSPWSFLDKSSSTSFLQGELYEAGINLTNLGFGGECFSTVVAETRSSTSPTATLKDFVVGTFGKCETSILTTPSDGSGVALEDSDADGVPDTSIGSGSVSVKDSADLTVSGVSTWSGSVAFSLCKLDEGTCTTDGTLIDTVNVTQAGPSPVVSDAATVTAAGRYCWRADFTSPTTGVPDATDDTAGECFIVNPLTPSLDTKAVDSPVDFGQPVQDTASLSGTATQPGDPIINGPAGAAAGGKITFTLLKADCSTPATGTGDNPQDVTVNGDNTSYGPVSFTPDASGTYHWAAQYFPAGGDPNNLGSTHNGSCSDTDETVVVQQIPTSITSAQSWVPNDEATVSTTSGSLDGVITFTLYDNGTCDGNVLYGPKSFPVSTATSLTATTDNTTPVTVDATVSWKAEYIPDSTNDKAHAGSDTDCHEQSTLTIDNNQP